MSRRPSSTAPPHPFHANRSPTAISRSHHSASPNSPAAQAQARSANNSTKRPPSPGGKTRHGQRSVQRSRSDGRSTTLPASRSCWRKRRAGTSCARRWQKRLESVAFLCSPNTTTCPFRPCSLSCLSFSLPRSRPSCSPRFGTNSRA